MATPRPRPQRPMVRAPRGARPRAAAELTSAPASDGRGAAGRRWAPRRRNVQEAFGGEANPHQEGLRATHSGDEAVALRVLSGQVTLLLVSAAGSAWRDPPRWATGDLLLENGIRLRFTIHDDASGGQLGSRSARAISEPHGGLSGLDVPVSS